MAKQVERGAKAKLIREQIEAYPDMKPKEAAEKLNLFAKQHGLALTFKPQEISTAKSKGSTSAVPKLAKPTGKAEELTTVSLTDLQKVRELGPERLKTMVDIVSP